MKRLKTNGVIAFLLGASILIGSIGHVVGREGEKVYDAPDLLLTQGQSEYDLCHGIKYNNKKYELSVWDDRRFDINTPGNYTVEYLLTPVDAASEPKETLAPKEPAGPNVPGGPKETSASQGTTGTPETSAVQETAGTPETSASQETAGTPETSASQETAGTPETSASQETAGTPETSESQETAGTPETDASQETAGTPDTGTSEDTSGTQDTGTSQDTSGTQDTGNSQDTSGTQDTGTSQDTSGTQDTGTSEDTSGTQDTGISQNAAGSQDNSSQGGQSQEQASDTSGTMKIQGKLLSPSTIRVANEKIILKVEAPALETKPAPQETVASATKPALQETAAPATKPAPQETAAPATKPAPQETAAPATKPAPQETAAPATKPAPQETTVPATTPAPEENNAQVQPSEPEKASASQAHSDGDDIYFTRTIVVKAAVQYQDVRYDIDTVSDPLADMDYDQNHYSLTVLDDGGFNGDRIGEYHIIYSLVNTDNGSKVADLERYIWITAPGVTFEAPDLELRLNQQDYDLQGEIDYDSGTYVLTTVDPDGVGTSQAGEQRVMFAMTAQPEGDSVPNASPSQADIPEMTSGPETSEAPEANAASETSETAFESVGPSAYMDNSSPAMSGGTEDFTAAPEKEDSELQSFVTQPVVAIFGRNVKVEDGPVVVIDAPPLVIAAGTETNHNLLEGVTAEDEDGNPVAIQVANRTALDQVSGEAATGEENGVAASETVNGEGGEGTASGRETEGAIAGEATPSQETEESDVDQEGPGLLAFRSLLIAEPPADLGDVSAQGQNQDQTQNQPQSQDQSQNEIKAENAEIPSNLPPGIYKVLLSAKHPVTGETFTMVRNVNVTRGSDELHAIDVTDGGGHVTIDVSQDHRPIYITPGNGMQELTLTLTGKGWIDPWTFVAVDPDTHQARRGTFSCISVSTITKKLTIVLADGADVQLYGADAEDGVSAADVAPEENGRQGKYAFGGGAGIFMQGTGEYSPWGYLTITGNGKLDIKGGNAGAGGPAKDGVGGYGGGGAGAAIGQIGGVGGIGTNGPNEPEIFDSQLPMPPGQYGQPPLGVPLVPSRVVIDAPNVTMKNGLGDSSSPLVRDASGAASGGGGMVAGSKIITSWTESPTAGPNAAGYGGGGGGAVPTGQSGGQGGFGQGYGRRPDVMNQHTGKGTPGGTSMDKGINMVVTAKEDAVQRRLSFPNLGAAVNAIKNDPHTVRKNYTITLTSDYALTADDQTQLNNFTVSDPDVTITLTGLDTPDQDPDQTKHKLTGLNGQIQFPPSSDSATTCAFIMQDIDLSKNIKINANGSKLTVGQGVNVKSGVAAEQQWTLTGGGGASGNGNIIVTGDQQKCSIIGKTAESGRCSLTIADPGVRVKEIFDCDVLDIKDGATLKIDQVMNLNRSWPVGDIKLGAGSTLTLSDYQNTAQSIQTTGDGASLELGRRPANPGTLPDLVLQGAVPAVLSAHPLKLSYTAGTPADGDNLISFPMAKTDARTEDYLNGFGGTWLIRGDQTNGMIQLWSSKIQLDYPTGRSEGFATLGEAMTAIKADNPAGSPKTGTYQMILLQDYNLTDRDNAVIQAATGLPDTVNVVLTGKQAQDTGTPKSLHFLRRGGDKQSTLRLPKRLKDGNGVQQSGAAFEIRDIDLRMDQTNPNTLGCYVIANGTKLTMGDGITGDALTLIGGQSFLPADLPPDTFQSNTGDTWLEIHSGSYNRIAGGDWITTQTGLNITQVGNTTVNVVGSNGIDRLNGGALFGENSNVNSTFTRNGNSSITVSEHGKVQYVIANSALFNEPMAPEQFLQKDSVMNGTSQVKVQAQGVSWSASANNSKQGDSKNTKLIMSGNCMLQQVLGFEEVRLTPGTQMGVAQLVQTDGPGADPAHPIGTFTQWNFQGNVSLRLTTKPEQLPCVIGSFRIEGTGNTLTFPRQAPGGPVPLLMVSDQPNVRVGDAQLALSYSDGSAPVNGDKLIQYVNKANASKEDYTSGFASGVWNIVADKTTGIVSLQEGAVRLDYPDTGQSPKMCGTLGQAMEAIKEDNPAGALKTGTYTVTLLQDYPLTEADKTGFAAATGLSPQAKVVITGKDALKPDNPVRKLTMNADLVLPLGSAGQTGAAFELRDMGISKGSGRVIAASGSKLTMGDGLTMDEPVNSIPSLAGGLLKTGDPNASLAGNTWLEVRSGTYNYVVGGNYIKATNTRTAPGSTINGSTTVNIDGAVTADAVYGGSYLDNSAGSGGILTQNGDRTVTVSGSAHVGNCSTGSTGGLAVTEDSVGPGYKAKLVLLDGATVAYVSGTNVSSASGGLRSLGDVEITVNGTVTVTERISEFDALNLTPGSKLNVTGTMTRMLPFAAGAQPAMLLDFQGNASLALGNMASKAGSFRIAGSGNTLTIPRTGPGSAPLTLDSVNPNVRVDGARLQLAYPVGTPVQAGDKLISFDPTKRNAVADDYVREIGGLAVLANGNSGYIYAGNTVTLQEKGGTIQFYPNLAGAMNAIGSKTGEYTVTFRKEDYVLTKEDGIALATQGGNTAKITYTSRFTTTAADPLEQGETVGQTVIRTLLVGYKTTPDSPKSDLNLNSHDSVVENIKFKYLQEGCSLYSNGHTLVIGPNVEVLSDGGYYPVIYGGAKSTQVPQTDVTIQSGKFSGIYGGGREAGADVAGNTSVTFGGDAEVVGAMYGGGEAGKVTGTSSLTVTGGKVMAADTGGNKNTVVAGGRTGDVGAASLAISGGTANGTVEIAGCDEGKVLGDVTISITENPGSPPPKAALGNLYGASLRPGQPAGTVGGNIHITITNGKDYGTIQGGRSQLASGKTSDITLKGGSIDVTNVTDFDAFNLGDPGAESDKVNVYLTGKLQGSEGTLNFWDGSVLTIQGTSTDPADLVIKDIHTNHSEPRSHLHMYKGPGADPSVAVSRPLTVTGQNTSAADDKLVLGEYGPGETQEGSIVGEEGDKLLAFQNQANAEPGNYISDFAGLDIVISKTEQGVLELGHSSTPTVALAGVSHTNEAGAVTAADRPGTTVTKTLTFQINSFKDSDFTQPGEAISSAYVDTSWTPDETWRAGGDIPSGGKAMAVVQDTANPIQWNGTVTMDITPPAATAPAYYYAHVRDAVNRVQTIVVDVHSPSQDASPVINTDGQGNYTFTVDLKDYKPANLGNPNIIYTVSGLKQMAWAAGKVGDPVPAGQAEALAPVMTEGGELKKVNTLSTPTIDDYSWTFTVPSEALGQNPAEMAVYLYMKDAMGNTGVCAIPLNGNLMDIQVPLWAGTVALRGGNSPYLISPDLYVVNRGEQPVKAELIGAEIPGNQELALTNKRNGPWAANELNLSVKSLDGSAGDVYFTSVNDLNPANPLNLGIMPGRNQADHGVGFSFGAIYDPGTIIRTNGWSQCLLTYRFSLVSPVPPVPPVPPAP